MKNKLIVLTLSAWLAIRLDAAESMSKQLAGQPPAVRQTVQALVGDGKLISLERAFENGQSVFEGEFRRGGVVRSFTLSADGMVISKQIFEKELPVQVAQTLRAQLADAQPGELYWTNNDGDPAYYAELTRSGVKLSVIIAPDGWLSACETTLAELPAPVREAVQKQLNGATPSRIERTDDGEETAYDVTEEVARRPRTWSFSEDGTLLAVEVSFPELPAAAQKAVQERLGSHRLIHIIKSDEDGATYYETTFVRGGLKHALTVLADGKLISAQIPPGEAPSAVQKALREQNAFLVRLEQDFGDDGSSFDVLLRARRKAIRLELKSDGTVK